MTGSALAAARRRGLLAALVLGLCVTAAPDARAHGGGMFNPEGFYLPVGLSTAVSVGAGRGPGWVVGGELSFVRLDDDGFWLGVYTDLLWDVHAEAFRWGIGPELGWAFLGLDGGVVNEWRGGDHRVGTQARFVATLGVVALYARWNVFLDRGPTEHIGEFGLLLKFPVPVAEGHAREPELEPEPWPPASPKPNGPGGDNR
jgi:hypothetical protein